MIPSRVPGLRLAFSAGVAQHDLAAPVHRTLERADHSLYQAKASGRNRSLVAGHIVKCQIARRFGMHLRTARRQTQRHQTHSHGQIVQFKPDQVGRIARAGQSVGHHQRHRLANKADGTPRQNRAFRTRADAAIARGDPFPGHSQNHTQRQQIV